MEFLFPLVLTIHVLAGLGIVGLVLMQHGKGADMGAAFGSGASGSLFGATGSANFLSRTTAVLAAVFFVTSLALSYLVTSRPKTGGSVMDNLPAQSAPAPKAPDAPTVPASSGDAAGAANAPAGSKAQDIPK